MIQYTQCHYYKRFDFTHDSVHSVSLLQEICYHPWFSTLSVIITRDLLLPMIVQQWKYNERLCTYDSVQFSVNITRDQLLHMIQYLLSHYNKIFTITHDSVPLSIITRFVITHDSVTYYPWFSAIQSNYKIFAISDSVPLSLIITRYLLSVIQCHSV